MNKQDEAFVVQSKSWIENQKKAIEYNDFLIHTYKQQIDFLRQKLDLETKERESNQQTLDGHIEFLEQFIEERNNNGYKNT